MGKRRKTEGVATYGVPADTLYSNLLALAHNVVRHEVDLNFTKRQIAEMLLSPETRRNLRAVWGLIDHGSVYDHHHMPGLEPLLQLNWHSMEIPTPREQAFDFQHDHPDADRFVSSVKQIDAWVGRFATVHYCIHWLLGASPSTVAHLFPAVEGLGAQGLPSKTRGYPDIAAGEMLPLFRESTVLIAQALLAPKFKVVEKASEDQIYLHFQSKLVRVNGMGGIHYERPNFGIAF